MRALLSAIRKHSIEETNCPGVSVPIAATRGQSALVGPTLEIMSASVPLDTMAMGSRMGDASVSLAIVEI